MKKKGLIVTVIVIVLLGLAVYGGLRFKDKIQKKGGIGFFLQALFKRIKGTDGAAPVPVVNTNPLEKVPDTNPIQKTNPFSSIKTNPFE